MTGVWLVATFFVRIVIASTCGNGVREGLEACDDGNTIGGDVGLLFGFVVS